MKAIQTRSPIHLFYEYLNLNSVNISIWVSDTQNIDSTTTPDYSLTSSAINNLASFEIAELLRSKNNYIFNSDFYTKRDTAKYVLVKGVLLDDTETQLEVKYDFLRVRDGYVTRQDLPQIYKNFIPTDVRDWSVKENTTITTNETNPFLSNDAYLLNDTDNNLQFGVSNPFQREGVYTFSVFLKQVTSNLFSLQFDVDKKVIFNIETQTVLSFLGDVIAYDITPVRDFVKLSICYNLDSNDFVGFASEIRDNNQSVIFFNPVVTRGNLINQDASDLVLQDNTTIFSDGLINTKIGFDKKLANTTYNFNVTDLTFTNQSVFLDAATSSLTYDQLDGTVTTQQITLTELDECKYTPAKVSFVNRFGVIQDLVFFKKREDTIQTDKESYKANVLQGSEYYNHIGQTQNISKSSKRSVTLNTGFYSEDFNTVFEQLQNSLYCWIDDEPANITGSQLQIKTQVNDKLINYTFDFEFSNDEINNIQ